MSKLGAEQQFCTLKIQSSHNAALLLFSTLAASHRRLFEVSGLKLAVCADPNNRDIQEKASWTAEQDSQGLPTVPTTIGVKKSCYWKI